MTYKKIARRSLGSALASVLVLGALAATPATSQVTPPRSVTNLSTGKGTLVQLSQPVADVFVADERIADVQVRSPTQLYIFGRTAGETTIYATSSGGNVVFSSSVRVGTNISTVDSMLNVALPDAAISVTPMNGLVLLTGTVAQPNDAAEAERLAQAFVGDTVKVISRLKTATPLQVNLQVKIAEVNREFAKEIGVNLLSRDATGGFLFGVAQGRPVGSIGNAPLPNFPTADASALYGLPAGTISLPFNTTTGQFITNPAATGGTTYNFNNLLTEGTTSLGFAGRLLGVDILAALDLAENDGLVSTLANPNLTALSGETASFLAGGEIPVPVSQELGTISIEYKQYGVSLAFTPTVLADGRISMRVRPEVSQLTQAGAVTLNGFSVPAFTTRRAETTVELGSGQSFMIGGLLSASENNAVEKAPFLGDLPILGALFKSNRFQRSKTELMIVVTPYLVKPVSANMVHLPTEGYSVPKDYERLLLNKTWKGNSGERDPRPTDGPSGQPAPGVTGARDNVPGDPKKSPEALALLAPPKKRDTSKDVDAAAPGFSGN